MSWSSIGLIALTVCFAMVHTVSSTQEDDEHTIRRMVDQAVIRLNQGDLTAYDDFWDESADYVGVDGRMTKGRAQIQALARQMAKRSAGQQSATIEQIRLTRARLHSAWGSLALALPSH